MRFYIAALLGFGWLSTLSGATLPGGFTEQAITGITVPAAMAFAPDGRLFICQQGGQLRVIKDGVLLSTPFLTLQTDTSIERGLVGVVVPDSQYVYVYYTVPGNPAHNRLSRFTQAGDVAAAGSEVILMEFEALYASIHNGGAMQFGADGKLYIAVGENGNSANSQTLSNRLGKVLRLNADGSIPADNPFYNAVGVTGNNRAIWALGLRNPFNFAFQPGTGRMYINDVGKDSYEEINEGQAGANYGWPETEGPTNNPNYKSPIFSYAHAGGGTAGGCAIVGAAFYNPATGNFPSTWNGKYFFADYCRGWIRALDPATKEVVDFATGIASPVALAISPTGSLYYASWSGNAVYKVDYTAGQAPAITQHPRNTSVPEGETATFSVNASGQQPFQYQWQKNQQDIPNATSQTLNVTSVSSGDNGTQFRVKVTNSFGSAVSNAATLTVTANNNNQAPKATITAPAAGTLYSGGQVISYAGTGTDQEDGNLPAANYCWIVNFHHETHYHPFLPQTCGVTSGLVTIPALSETSANVWYRFTLTVRDSGGRTSSTFVDVPPRKVNLTLKTNPAGLQLTLDGQPMTAPVQVASVVGIVRSIGAPGQLPVGGTRQGFASWSDNGAATHDIATPAADTTYTATYTTQHLLTVAMNISGAGTVAENPASADGFYNAGVSVQLTASPSAGFKFDSWGGDASGTANQAGVSMSAPRSVSANFVSTALSCADDLSHNATTVGFSGDIRVIEVSAGPACNWQSVSSAPWMTILSGSSGNGNGTVRFRVDANGDAAPRTGIITISGRPYQVTQSAAGCTFTLTGPNFVLAGAAAPVPYRLSISTGPNCDWIAMAYPSFMTMTGATSGRGSGTVSFVLPQNDNAPRQGYLTIGGQFWRFVQQSLVPVSPFSDVPATYPFAGSISLLKANGLSTGCGGGQYCPEDPMTRSEMAAFIIRALYGETFSYSSQPLFTDVGPANPYFKYVQKLREIGATNGCTATTFCPDDSVTRGQMAAFIIRARLGLLYTDLFPVLPAPLFADVGSGNIFFPYIQKMKELGITSGCTETQYCDNDRNTRGQMAVFLTRAFLLP
ncbi:MAG: PQQ-dependent sugar dehydrogenase [Bryobacterales bacterium]|nr:PQQ-dependent sugar dehydrogenase [Bryobacterales bacterium]